MVPVGPDHVAVGQVVGSKPSSPVVWVAIFWPPVLESEVDQRVLVLISTPPVLLTQTLNMFLKNGRWRHHSTSDVLAAIPWPAFKVATAPGVFQVTDHEGAVRRRASSEEIETLSFSSTISPAGLEHAAAALAGVGEWHEMFDKMRPGSTTEELVLGR